MCVCVCQTRGPPPKRIGVLSISLQTCLRKSIPPTKIITLTHSRLVCLRVKSIKVLAKPKGSSTTSLDRNKVLGPTLVPSSLRPVPWAAVLLEEGVSS